MNWLKLILKGKLKDAGVQGVKNDVQNIRVFTTTHFKGINQFIFELLFFINDSEKRLFLSDFENLLEELKITYETSLQDFNRIISQYEESNSEWLQLHRFLVEFDSFKVTEINGETSEQLEEKPFKSLDEIMLHNIGYLIADFNINSKLKHNVQDLSFEEKLINDSIELQNNWSYERIDNYKFLAFAFMKVGNHKKFDKYISRIEHEFNKYELSDNVLAQHCREIGESFYQIGVTKEAIKWFEKGLEKNPKIGIKKMLNELKRNNL